MKKVWLCCLLLMNIGLFAQCIDVAITALPDAINTPVCKGTTVTLTADNSGSAIAPVNPVYYWIVGTDTTLGTGNTFTVDAYGQTVSVLMSTSTGCVFPDSDTATSAEVTLQVVTIDDNDSQLNYGCLTEVGDVQFTPSSSNGGIGPYDVTLLGVTNQTGLFPNVPAGSYDVYLDDSNGCRDTGQVVVAPLVDITSIASPNIVCNQTTADVVTNTSTTGTSTSYTYELVGVETNSDGSFSSVPSGTYTLYTTDEDGCKDTSIVIITPEVCADPDPRNAFSPNGDLIDDTWTIANIQFYPESEVYIFDRWGQRVYYKKGYDNSDGWTGEYLGVVLPVSTYFYVIKAPVEGGDDLVFKGPISIFR